MSSVLPHPTAITPRLLRTGNWGETTQWEDHITTAMPVETLCSAAFCIAIQDNKIVLMRAERGWGMLGGHIESGESLAETLHREALEEGGFVIDEYLFCGYRKITASVPTPHPDPTRTYPFPISHIPFSIAVTSQPLRPATGEEVLETAAFATDEIETMQINDWPVIKAAWDMVAATKM